MGSQGPGDIPKVVRRRARRNRKPKPPSAAAVQRATRGAAPLSQKPVRPKRVQRPPTVRQVQSRTQNARPLSQKPVRPKQVVRPLAPTAKPPHVTRAAPPEGARSVQQIQRGTAVRGYDTLTGRQKRQRVAQAQRKFVAGKADESDRAILHAHATRVAGNQKRVAATKAFNAITGTTALDVARGTVDSAKRADAAAAKAAKQTK